MPIIGCTKEDNCKKDAYLKALAARARAKEKGADDNVVSNVVEVANTSMGEMEKSETVETEEKLAEAEEAVAENIPTEETEELPAEEEVKEEE